MRSSDTHHTVRSEGGEGYRHTVEHTVHVRGDQRGSGTGSLLMEELIDQAMRQQLHSMIGGVDANNEGSIRFHRKFGFKEVGRLPEVGRKFDQWLDLVLMQRML